MPIYTYRCEDCGVQFERNQKFSDAPLTRCPECGKKSLRKVYLPVGIVFKGSGFYATDHRSPSGSRSGAHGEEKTATESKPDSSSSESSEKSSSEKSQPAASTSSSAEAK